MTAELKTSDTQNNSLTTDLPEDLSTIKETTSRIQSWGRNRSCPEGKEEEKILPFINYVLVR